MRRATFIVTIVLAVCLVFVSSALCGEEQGLGRYKIYSSCGTQPLMVLLDTKTGKLWQISSDMAGKIKTEGITVEGLAFSGKDADTMNREIGQISLDNIAQQKRQECKDRLISAFSYELDKDKADCVVNDFVSGSK